MSCRVSIYISFEKANPPLKEARKLSIPPSNWIDVVLCQELIFILLSTESIANILKRLESDNALKIIENLDEKKKNKVLDKLPPKDRFLLQEGLSSPEDSAARIMQREFTAIPSDWSVGQTIDYLRENKDLPEEFLEIYIVDNEFKPIGTVPSSKVLRAPREAKMISIMSETQFFYSS